MVTLAEIATVFVYAMTNNIRTKLPAFLQVAVHKNKAHVSMNAHTRYTYVNGK